MYWYIIIIVVVVVITLYIIISVFDFQVQLKVLVLSFQVFYGLIPEYLLLLAQPTPWKRRGTCSPHVVCLLVEII